MAVGRETYGWASKDRNDRLSSIRQCAEMDETSGGRSRFSSAGELVCSREIVRPRYFASPPAAQAIITRSELLPRYLEGRVFLLAEDRSALHSWLSPSNASSERS